MKELTMHTLQLASVARAYVYAGDWVADCPRDGCSSVEHLYTRLNPRDPQSPRIVRTSSFACSNCGQQAPVEWPTHQDEITAVLAVRPIPHTRNWYPDGHDTAVRFRVPHGQTVQQLRDESAEHGVDPGPALQGVS